jgi:ribosomal protein S12 methylthiotransferase
VPTPPAVAFVTLGCPKNEVDSDRMRADALASAYRVVGDTADADVVVLNTCAFIQEAVEEAIAEILELSLWKQAREGRSLVVAGCLPSRYGGDLATELPEVDAFLPVAEERALLRVLSELTGGSAKRGAGPTRTVECATAYLQVSDGCDRHCAYCTIPSIRGRHVSRPFADVLVEARELLDGGARELVLVGQDVSAYGRDLAPRRALADLVSAVASLPGEYRVRLMYLQPDGVSDELLAVMAASPRVCRYLDIPIQHTSAVVLRRMGRPGDAESLFALIEHIRSLMPDVVLRTTVMAGFPGETRADMAELTRFLVAAAFDYVGVFAFSPEEGTRAATLPEQVPARTRVARAQRLRDTADAVGVGRAAAFVGSTQIVLVEGVDEDGVTFGRTCGQAPEVDGLTLLDGPQTPGTFVRAHIVASEFYDLIGEVLA